MSVTTQAVTIALMFEHERVAVVLTVISCGYSVLQYPHYKIIILLLLNYNYLTVNKRQVA